MGPMLNRETFKHINHYSTIQDGFSLYHGLYDPRRRLGHLNQVERCILPHSDPSLPQTFPSLHLEVSCPFGLNMDPRTFTRITCTFTGAEFEA